ncbi:MAG: hypothetical protein ACREX4_18170 [Gammaproteobacteria bacterium]
MADIETVVISSLVGAAVSYIGAVAKSALDFRTKVDESLIKTRTDVYKVLWKMTALLPKWPRAEDVTYEQIENLSKQFREWYFEEGGIYLSRKAQKAYATLQDTISDVLKASSPGKVTPKDYDAIRDKCSSLRTEMTEDLLSRRSVNFLWPF